MSGAACFNGSFTGEQYFGFRVLDRHLAVESLPCSTREEGQTWKNIDRCLSPEECDFSVVVISRTFHLESCTSTHITPSFQPSMVEGEISLHADY